MGMEGLRYGMNDNKRSVFCLQSSFCGEGADYEKKCESKRLISFAILAGSGC
ncbi:unnamed protein product [Strongylus vulgaris]|uniref:Uncharacterized protein n=1 Tax=Strongylus vulgaris TaxID=40348 RepID=A0A3P7JUK6_STRVU|nr:unnamed protein product [Strongylus vulgaris]